LHYGLAAILIFVGGKMLLAEYYPLPTWIALGIVGTVLLVSVAASVAFPKGQEG
jgi:tellurite resistance protein TerC